MQKPDAVLSVSEINRYVKGLIQGDPRLRDLIIQKTGSFTNSSGLTYINTPALQNGRGQKEDWQVICDLAREMGADWQYTSLEDVREAMEGLFAG